MADQSLPISPRSSASASHPSKAELFSAFDSEENVPVKMTPGRDPRSLDKVRPWESQTAPQVTTPAAPSSPPPQFRKRKALSQDPDDDEIEAFLADHKMEIPDELAREARAAMEKRKAKREDVRKGEADLMEARRIVALAAAREKSVTDDLARTRTHLDEIVAERLEIEEKMSAKGPAAINLRASRR